VMITLALGIVVWGLAQRWVSLTQGGAFPFFRLGFQESKG